MFNSAFRNFDLVARYIGERFIFCFPETTEDNAKEILRRVVTNLEQTSFELAGSNTARLKFNYGTCPISADTDIELAIKQAESDVDQ